MQPNNAECSLTIINKLIITQNHPQMTTDYLIPIMYSFYLKTFFHTHDPIILISTCIKSTETLWTGHCCFTTMRPSFYRNKRENTISTEAKKKKNGDTKFVLFIVEHDDHITRRKKKFFFSLYTRPRIRIFIYFPIILMILP